MKKKPGKSNTGSSSDLTFTSETDKSTDSAQLGKRTALKRIFSRKGKQNSSKLDHREYINSSTNSNSLPKIPRVSEFGNIFGTGSAATDRASREQSNIGSPLKFSVQSPDVTRTTHEANNQQSTGKPSASQSQSHSTIHQQQPRSNASPGSPKASESQATHTTHNSIVPKKTINDTAKTASNGALPTVSKPTEEIKRSSSEYSRPSSSRSENTAHPNPSKVQSPSVHSGSKNPHELHSSANDKTSQQRSNLNLKRPDSFRESSVITSQVAQAMQGTETGDLFEQKNPDPKLKDSISSPKSVSTTDPKQNEQRNLVLATANSVEPSTLTTEEDSHMQHTRSNIEKAQSSSNDQSPIDSLLTDTSNTAEQASQKIPKATNKSLTPTESQKVDGAQNDPAKPNSANPRTDINTNKGTLEKGKSQIKITPSQLSVGRSEPELATVSKVSPAASSPKRTENDNNHKETTEESKQSEFLKNNLKKQIAGTADDKSNESKSTENTEATKENSGWVSKLWDNLPNYNINPFGKKE